MVMAAVFAKDVEVAGLTVPEFGGVVHIDTKEKMVIISIQEPAKYPVPGDELTFLVEGVAVALNLFIHGANGGYAGELKFPKEKP